MDFDLTDEQQATIDVAAKLLGDKATPDAIRAVEHADDLRFDRALWSAMADAGLLGIAVPAEQSRGRHKPRVVKRKMSNFLSLHSGVVEAPLCNGRGLQYPLSESHPAGRLTTLTLHHGCRNRVSVI